MKTPGPGLLQRLPLYQNNFVMDIVPTWIRNGDLDLSPPYQRGDVWGKIRRQNLIKSILTRIPVPTIILNNRMEAGWPNWEKIPYLGVIDGKQRLTTVAMLFADRLDVPGEWFGLAGPKLYSQLSLKSQRAISNTPLAVSVGQLASMDQEREVFELVNFGGVPQGQVDPEFQ